MMECIESRARSWRRFSDGPHETRHVSPVLVKRNDRKPLENWPIRELFLSARAD
jgi:hypothetical protein